MDNPVTPLRPAEYEALKESIRQRGVLVPIVVNQHGKIIDGHHRKEICDLFAMDCPTDVKTYENASKPGEPFSKEEMIDALGINSQRRQLDDYSAGMLNLKLLELRGVERGRGKKNTGLKAEDVAKEAGQTLRTFYRRCQLAEVLQREGMADLRDAIQSDELSASEAMALARQRIEEPTGESAHARIVASQLKGMRRKKKLSPVVLARADGFEEGLRWAHECLTGQPASEEWLLEAFDVWKSEREAAGNGGRPVSLPSPA